MYFSGFQSNLQLVQDLEILSSIKTVGSYTREVSESSYCMEATTRKEHYSRNHSKIYRIG